MKRLSMAAFSVKAESAFRNLVLAPEFSCLGGKAALTDQACCFIALNRMGTMQAARELSYSLFDFARSTKMKAKPFSSFVAVFRGPLQLTEREFETCLWLQLRQLHRIDPSGWDPQVSANPEEPNFSFSFAGQAFYVVGLHAKSSRIARRFRWPTLVFNAHEQFERLRTAGNYKRMQKMIRDREVALQGNVNPMLSEFGEQSEACQYSGRTVGRNWSAPFPKGSSSSA